ncbi:hypothetical protein CONLIGDRAFT_650129 [Coniochaeta ligniaria NRRL 30616]|uniref:Ig-like domain-containing protein n=1 Tax=Coniochaeta ligniaria NRRL 30616 TaxID=1408157 RepID=A0A1J7IZI0_9PEZI|nr:hypothetical protein CONLIGDRAFT_650129 [Coniochaeta ligniaria NRRL 30616]
MRLIISAAAAASLLPLVLADCTHNNCLRAVLADSIPTRSGLADCNSYLQTTVTPATRFCWDKLTEPKLNSTVTVTATETTTSPETVTTTVGPTVVDIITLDTTISTSTTAYIFLAKRQETATPTSIQPYAYTACHSDVASYTSACFCIGATANTVYAPTPIVTVTVSTTAVATSTQTDIATTTSTTFTTLTRTATSVSTIEATCPQPALLGSCWQVVINYPEDGTEAVYNNIVATSCILPPAGYRTLNIAGDPGSPCPAVASCTAAWSWDDWLYGFALYYSRSAGEYICVAYDYYPINAGQFTEFDSDVVEVYGWENP